ncbi:MAG: hypothetical protein JXA10_19720, partial [Anaerolineae bacterium]|nr:hypothetical protein [Anaerolineae bacterium]
MRHRHLLWFGLLAAVLVTLTLGYATFFAAAQATVRIQYGDTVTGEIATTNEIDRWEFDGTQDDVIAIQINRTDGNLIPSITLNDPEGVMILSLDWPVDGPAQILFTATLRTSGPHVLAISGATRNTNTTGAYTLNLTLQEAGTQEEGILTYGRVVSGEITDTTFREFWTFRGTRGDVIDAIMSATSGDLDTYLSLISPQGDVLVSTDFGSTGTDAALFAVTLPTTGNYSLSARRAGGNFGESGTTQGTYNLALTLRQAGSEDVEPTPLMLTPGIGTRGRLNADAPTALYSVNARGVLALALDMTDPTQVGTLTVMTPSGALLNTFSGITPVRANVTLPEQGTYWIEVSAIGLREAIPLDFGINVEQLTTTQRAARPLIYDRPQRITASSTQPEAWYFHGQTGDLVEIALTPFNPELAESSMQIVAPDGTVVATRSIRTQTTQSLLLADSGAYEIILSPGALSDGYQIVVNKQGMAGLDFKQYTEPVEQGTLPTTNAVEGVLDVGGSDTWIIDVQEAQTWQFRLDQSGTDVSAGLIIEAPNGEWLDMITTDRLTNTATLRVHLPHAGRYRAVVFDPTHEASHTYTLQGAPGEGGEFALDTPVKGVLTTTKPSDRWSVLVPSDMLLNVDVTLLVGTSAPTLQIVGPDGLLVATNASGEQRDSLKLVGIPVEYGGQFDIVIKQPSTSERLVYLVETTVVAPFGHTANVTPFVDLPVEEVFATDISTDTASTWVNLADHITPRILPDAEFLAVAASMGFDTLNRGEIRTDQGYQAWQFSVNANQMVSFSVVALEDTSGPDLFVLNAGGTVLAETLQTGTSSAYMTHRFADGGTYTLVVKLDHGGRYTLAASVLTGIDETVPQVISGQTMSYGDVMEGEIIQPDDVQRYVFWGKAGDVISSQALRTQGNTNLNLTLFDTNNTTLQQAAMSTIPPLTEIVDYRLAGDGLYQLMVTHEGDDAGIAGRFALNLTLTESTANQRDGGVLIAGEPSIASLETNNAPDHWLFAGQSGEQVTIRLEPLTDGTPTPLTLQLADSAGNVFLQKETLIGQGGLAFDRVLLPRGGVYQAMVSGGRTPGVYRISLERDTRNTQDDERAIRYGETTGKVLTPENFLDVWTFAGTAGDVVTAHVRTVRGDLPTLSVQLRAQDGTVLETSLEDGAGSRLEQIVLPMDGHYSLIVGNVDGTFAGEAAYEVTLLLEDTAARSMGTVTTYGHAVEGYFYLDDSIDTWIFEGRQGDVISATVSSTASDLYPVIELIATDWRSASVAGQAAILASAQGAENSPTMLEFVLPATGAYTLVLRDQALVGGPYTLELDTLTPTA